MLKVENIHSSYGTSQVLFGIDLELRKGQLVTMMGRNGMGKTTTIRAITGLTPPRSGRILLDDRDLTNLKPHQIGQAGIALVPEGRQIFPTLTVRENLVATARKPVDGSRGWTLTKVFDLFPRLKERSDQMGNSLSGGEQQMLAIGRAMLTNPRVLILDEATEGLAPLIRHEIWKILAELKAEGQTILVVDKNLDEMAHVADYAYVVQKGQIAWRGSIASMRAIPDFAETYLGV